MYCSSPVRQRSPVRRWRRAAAIFSAGVVGSVLLAFNAPASAHTELDQASPSPGSEVSGSQQTVRLAFTEDIDIDLATVIVRAPNGDNLAKGSPQSVGGAVLQPIKPMSVRGRYEVAYRVLSVDGHPISGSYRFRVTTPVRPTVSPVAEAEPAAAAPSPAATAPASQQGTQQNAGQARTDAAPADTQPSATTPLVLGGLVLLLVIAGGALAARGRRTGSTPPTP